MRVQQRPRRDAESTRRRVIEAAAKEFSQRGFDGTTLSAIAGRAKVSKQLIAYHFGTKERLFQQVHDEKFRPLAHWSETLPENPTDLLKERFRRRLSDAEYIRFLVWEAASSRNRTIPGERDRQQRISEYGQELRRMQQNGQLPAELDYRMIQLATLSLATYPLAFRQITRMVTGRNSSDPAFQRDWMTFLQQLGERMFQVRDGAKRARQAALPEYKTAAASRG